MSGIPNLALHRKIAARLATSAPGEERYDVADEVSTRIGPAFSLFLYRDGVTVADLVYALPLVVDGETLSTPGTPTGSVADADIDSGTWTARIRSADGIYEIAFDRVGKEEIAPVITGTPKVGETLTVSDGVFPLDVLVSDDIDDAYGVSVSFAIGMDSDLPAAGTPPEPSVYTYYSAASPWNTPIPEDATYYGPSDARTAQIRKTSVSSGTVVWAVNAQQDYAIPVHQAVPGGPTKTIRVRDMFGNPRRFDEDVTIPWPAGAVPATGSDKHFCILDADGVTSHDMWHCAIQGDGSYISASYCRTRLDGTGWNLFPDQLPGTIGPHNRNPAEAVAGFGAARAVSVGLLGGLITQEDVATGVINHAIGMALPREFIRRGPRVYPADMTDGWYDGDSSSNGAIAYSMRFALPKSLNINALGLSPQWVIVFLAVQTHGIYIFDVGGAGGRTGSIYSEYPGAHSFGMALRSTQAYAFGQMIPRLEFVDWA